MTTKNNPPTAPRAVAIHTHGCKLNQADSQELARQFQEAGYRLAAPHAPADIIILNTCTVTAAADAKARQYLRSARRRNPNALIVATGCYAQRAPNELQNLPEVSLIINNNAKPSLPQSAIAALQTKTPPTPQPAPPTDTPQSANPTRTRAMIKIQEGCDQVCAYCIVPKVRGRERSIPPETIIAQINRRAADGFREAALTGTQLGTYGFDLPNDASLTLLLERILAETRIERLRVSSLQAHEITQPLLDLWRNPRLMPHFHIPLQSGCDATLRNMRRRYDTAQFAAAVTLTRRMYPHAGITTDIIAGFPGETPAQFAAALQFAAEMRFADIHAFPYSPRPGTSAAHHQNPVPEPEKRARMAHLLELAAQSRQNFRQSQIGTTRPTLWERAARHNLWSGLTDNYLRVRAQSPTPLSNQITNAHLTALDGDWLLAEPHPA